MELIIQHLQNSLEDTILSKAEKGELKLLVSKHSLSDHELSFLRSKIYSLAMEKANAENYSFIIEWIKAANNALVTNSEGAGVFFSPGEECRNAIIQRINGAINQIGICVFTISDDRITDAIVTAHKKGVNVKIITDNDKSWDEGSDIKQLAKVGVPIKMDSTPNHMHHKFMVVDSKALLTGSYNWTVSAMRYNHENILITEEAGVVRSFLKEFDNLWRQMIEYK
jgi:phosphatidylserine/phosphatidylglycerophosphate/cardiolipin synthase-like enzyme